MGGCGCKNKNQSTQVQQGQVSSQTVQSANKQQSESIKETIKKTVEKYYYTDKKSNGWVKG